MCSSISLLDEHDRYETNKLDGQSGWTYGCMNNHDIFAIVISLSPRKKHKLDNGIEFEPLIIWYLIPKILCNF